MPPTPSRDADGKVLHGDAWLAGLPPTTTASRSSTARRTRAPPGASCASASRRCWAKWSSSLADGSDPRQQWARSILFKVLLPNLVLHRGRGVRGALGGGARAQAAAGR